MTVLSWLTRNAYGPSMPLALAAERGYDDEAHRLAILAAIERDPDGDPFMDGEVTLTHPVNWLTEEEVENL